MFMNIRYIVRKVAMFYSSVVYTEMNAAMGAVTIRVIKMMVL